MLYVFSKLSIYSFNLISSFSKILRECLCVLEKNWIPKILIFSFILLVNISSMSSLLIPNWFPLVSLNKTDIFLLFFEHIFSSKFHCSSDSTVNFNGKEFENIFSIESISLLTPEIIILSNGTPSLTAISYSPKEHNSNPSICWNIYGITKVFAFTAYTKFTSFPKNFFK